MIDQRILGRYDNGIGKTWDDPNYMKFYNDGAVNFPYLSDGMWFLTQHRRWGLLKEDPDYLAVAKKVNQVELYKQAAALAKAPVPKDPMRTSKLIDGVVWDGKDPKKYAAASRSSVTPEPEESDDERSAPPSRAGRRRRAAARGRPSAAACSQTASRDSVAKTSVVTDGARPQAPAAPAPAATARRSPAAARRRRTELC